MESPRRLQLDSKTVLVFLLGGLLLIPMLVVSFYAQNVASYKNCMNSIQPPLNHPSLVLSLQAPLSTRWSPQIAFIAKKDASSTPTPAESEDSQERILLANALPDLPEPRRQCTSGTDLPKLVTIQHWLSAKQRPRESITLMTQLSADRYDLMLYMPQPSHIHTKTPRIYTCILSITVNSMKMVLHLTIALSS